MKKMIKVVGESRYRAFKEYYEAMGKGVFHPASNFVNLKEGYYYYSGLSINLCEGIGLMLPVCSELYLIYDELWGKLKEGAPISRKNVLKLINGVLSPDEMGETETGYLRLWWDEHVQYSGDALMMKYYEGADIAHEAIKEMKGWLSQNWGAIDWGKLDILMVNGDVKNCPNKLRQKLYGPGDPFDALFIVKPEPVEELALRLDGSELSANVNGLEFWDLPDENVSSLYMHAYKALAEKEGR